MPSSELTQVRASGVAGAGGAGGAGGALAVGALAVGALPVGRGGGVRIAASKRLNASLVSPARASAAPAN